MPKLFIGIDLSTSWNLSYFRTGMREPETISPATQKIAMPRERGEWLPFLKHLLQLVPNLGDVSKISGLCFSLEEVDLESAFLLKGLMEEAGLANDRVFLQERKESFCYYAINQARSLYQKEVLLFDCDEDRVDCLALSRKAGSSPTVMVVEEAGSSHLPTEAVARDAAFSSFSQEMVAGRAVSSIYLVGDGFDGDWLKGSVPMLRQDGRVFLGKDLYAKGACYGAYGYLENEKKSQMARLKEHGDYLLGQEAYAAAIQEYQKILESDLLEQESILFRGRVWHNLGVALARMFLFEEAAEYFQKADETGGFPASHQAYLDAIQCMSANRKPDEENKNEGKELPELEQIEGLKEEYRFKYARKG